jgi:hypothetical protein
VALDRLDLVEAKVGGSIVEASSPPPYQNKHTDRPDPTRDETI